MNSKTQKTNTAHQTTEKYNPADIEPKWQKWWEENKIYSPDIEKAKKPFYNLMMFPYPSAEGLHVGNMYAFTGADVYGRFQRMQGYDVLEPIGLDGFGIHSENYALKVGSHPKDQSEKSEKNFYRQFRITGNGYDWERTVETYNANYYKWTQWLFTQMFKHGLAYRKAAKVNWCPSCLTVLSDEQVIAGECERCGSVVEKKNLEQWFFRITDYAGKLLDNLENLDWSERVKVAQQNWIGRSTGALITFPVDKKDRNDNPKSNSLEVFTTRPDTLFGVTFLVISPEHPLVEQILAGQANVEHSVRDELNAYVRRVQQLSEIERTAEGREKTGVFSGLNAIHPISKEKLPIWVADYVLMGYGTGAIMAVPAHDERDYEFAVKFDLPVVRVVSPTGVNARSYLMGGDNISDEDLKKAGVSIIETKENGVRLLEIPENALKAYKELVKEKLTPGYWNDVVGSEISFIFKAKSGNISEYLLDISTIGEVAKLCSEFSNDPIEITSKIWRYLAQNSWYRPLIANHTAGVLENSGNWNGKAVPENMSEIISDLEKRGIGQAQTQYHLRDWLISRQRYWGPPIPMLYCSTCADEGRSWFTSDEGKTHREISNFKFQISNSEEWNSLGWYPVPDTQLPVELPYIEDFKPLGTGKAPLANHPEFYTVACPHCGSEARRETDVSDTFLDSAWYFLRYPSTDIESSAFDIDRTKNWLPVNIYIGGAEHSVLHLLYARFIAMVLHDFGYVDFDEPFKRFYAHGLIIKEGAKMSKSKGNVIVPDDYIQKYGSDTLRMYLMFLGPFNQGGDFYDTGIEGMHRFVRRVWTLLTKDQRSHETSPGQAKTNDQKLSEERLYWMHKTIKAVTEDMQELAYNTAIARMMEWYNFLSEELRTKNLELRIEEVEVFLKLLAPFAPHMAEEIWQSLQNSKIKTKNSKLNSIHHQSWPEYDGKYLVADSVVVVVQVNGKRRAEIEIRSSEIDKKEEVEKQAREQIGKHLVGSEIIKVIHVPGKIINFVVESS